LNIYLASILVILLFRFREIYTFIFDKVLENPSLLKKKLLVIGFLLLDKKGKMDSHFHGNDRRGGWNDKKKRGNDMKEGEKIAPLFIKRLPRMIFN